MPSPNEVHQRFKQLVDECELLALYLNQSAKAKQRRRWLGEMKVILDKMDELMDVRHPHCGAGVSAPPSTMQARQPDRTSNAASQIT